MEIDLATSSTLSGLGFEPDFAATQPVYIQLTAVFSQAIGGGHIAIGARLPSERECAQHFGVSRTTVTAAYQELKATGLVRSYVGRGSVVIANGWGARNAGAGRLRGGWQ